MSEPARAVVYSFADYVALESYSNVRHEFRDGWILAMAGGTPEHAALCAAVSGLILQHLMGSQCGVFSSDLRVRVVATGLTTYPDVSVVCSPRTVDPQDRNTVTNPRVLVEVTSPSSEEYDLGEKREHYQQIASLHEYIVVSHREPRVELWRRGDSTWTHTVLRAGETVVLSSIDASFEVDQLYRLAAQAQ